MSKLVLKNGAKRYGAFEAVARISDDTGPGVVVAPLGYWAKNSPNGRTVNALNPPAFADYGNAPTFSDTLVEIASAAG